MTDDERARVRESFDDAVRGADPERAADRYLARVREVATDDDRDPDWLPWLVGDALARTVRADESPFGDRESQVDLVARVAASAVHSRWRAVDDLELAGDPYFERVVTGLRTVASDDVGFVERVVRETATLLDEAYPGTAVLDWQDAFERV
jgi:hypothetical protein